MKKENSISEELIAPCGMNCAVCSRYRAHVHDLKRSRCIGCRPRNERCLYLFGKCEGMNHASGGNAAFCFECEYYPCKQINRVDDRYRRNFNVSIKENLEFIRSKGLHRFIDEQYKRYRCPKCGSVISIHNGKCFHCDTITRLIEKTDERRKSIVKKTTVKGNSKRNS